MHACLLLSEGPPALPSPSWNADLVSGHALQCHVSGFSMAGYEN